jgi:predicted nucleic acid-binding protein
VNRRRVLIDTGPLVAIYAASDAHHERCLDELARLKPPLMTCWPVLTEAHWLLRNDSRAAEALLQGFAEGLTALLPMDAGALPWIAAFLRRYKNLGAQFADASLVYLAERDGISTVFTLDRRNFTVYRYAKNRRFTLLPEP